MDIYLTYRGQIRSNRDRETVWKMREAFHSQLERLWGKEPFSILKKWEDTKFEAGAPNFVRNVGNQTFVPFYGEKVGIGVNLEIKLLAGMPPRQPVLNNGDLDNRVKRIIDALQAPQQENEVLPDLPAGSRWYCAVDNDSSVKHITASLSPYLDSNDPQDSFAFIKIIPAAQRVSLDTLAMIV